MQLILDLDDTVIVGGGLHPRFDEFRAWVRRSGHSVLVWSSHSDGGAFASLMGYDFLSKDAPSSPSGDVLIDDSAEQFKGLCDVKEVYASLESFLQSVSDSSTQVSPESA